MSSSPTQTPSHITVLGAGSWGTALAILLARNGQQVSLWGRNNEQLQTMAHEQCNRFYLPDTPFPNNLQAEPDFTQSLAQADYILIAVPSSGFRELLEKIKPLNKPIIWASKGIEPGSNLLLHTVITDVLGTHYPAALLSGPSFAREVAEGLPTAVVIASADNTYAEQVINLFANAHFRPYYSADMIGAEVGGAVKNVLAIAAGISDGLGFGANARSALITRGLNEITQLGAALGAQANTFMGLSGLGDLVLTCTDNLSRNRRFGLALGKGQTAEQAFSEIGQVVEGAENVQQVHALAQQFGLALPICEHVYQVLNHSMTPLAAVESLFSRDLKAE
jgi:glycerol-3-phosphate dehydrogenase (NAD(P)+)